MFLLEHTCSIQRFQDVGSNGRKQMGDVASGVDCLIIPMDTRDAIQNGYEVSKAYEGYFAEGTDVQEGDQLIHDGYQYLVGVVHVYKGLMMVNHIKAELSKEAGSIL